MECAVADHVEPCLGVGCAGVFDAAVEFGGEEEYVGVAEEAPGVVVVGAWVGC